MHIYLHSAGLQLFSLIGGVILPLIIDALTKWSVSARVKAVALLIASLASAFVAALIATPAGTGFDVEAWAWTAVPTFVIAVAALFGLHMPTGLHTVAVNAFTGKPPVQPPAAAVVSARWDAPSNVNVLGPEHPHPGDH